MSKQVFEQKEWCVEAVKQVSKVATDSITNLIENETPEIREMFGTQGLKLVERFIRTDFTDQIVSDLKWIDCNSRGTSDNELVERINDMLDGLIEECERYVKLNMINEQSTTIVIDCSTLIINRVKAYVEEYFMFAEDNNE